MEIYIYIAFFIGVLSLDRKVSLFLPFVLLYFISAFRGHHVGIDYEGYRLAYENEISYRFPMKYLMFKFEVGWIFLNEFVQLFFGSFEVLIGIVSFFTIAPIFYVIKKETKSPILGILLYVLLFYYSLPFSLLKQGLAVSFFILGVYFFSENKKSKSLLSTIFFSIIHYSSIALIPISFLANYLKISNKKVFIALGITFIIGIAGISDAARTLINLLPFEKYANYVDYKSDVEFNRLNLYFSLIPKNIICVLIFYYLPNTYGKEIYKNLFFFGLIIANLFISISLISRFVLYLFPFEIILLTNLIYSYKGRKKDFLSKSIIGYALLYFIYNLMTNRGGIIPYEVNFQW